MTKYIARRFLQIIPVIIGVTIITYFAIFLAPGDPVQSMLGMSASEEQIAEVKAQLGLDQPIYMQYFTWLRNVLKGDLGRSLQNNKPVLQMIKTRLPATLQLGIASFIISTIIGITTGVISAVKRNESTDYIVRFFAMLGVSMPLFWQGIMLILIFALYIPILPASGKGDIIWSIEGLKHLILPAITLGTSTAASLSRLTRSSMLEVLQKDYIVTARSKGLKSRTVIYKHALRNALIPVITILAFRIGAIMGGSVITETVFAWPGMGRLSVKALMARDFPVILGTVLVISTLYIFANAVVDVLYAVVDPRITYD